MADNSNLPTIPRGTGLNTPTTLDSRYKLDGLTYPADLLAENNPYGSNYVVFYINVHQDSFLAKESKDGYIDASRQSLRGEISKISGTALKGLGVVAAGTAVNAAGVAQKVSGAVGAPLTGAAATVTNFGVGGALGAAVVDNIGQAQAQYKNQVKAIALYMPGDLSIKYGTRWEETSLAGTTAMGMALDTAAAATKAGAGAAPAWTGPIGKMIGGVVGAVKGAGQAAGIGVDYTSGLALQVPGVGEALSKATGTAANPKKEQLFKEVEYRTFTFSYQFHPRSLKEAQDVKSIIEQFKLHMHPEFRPGTNQFLYIYPSEFDIYYYHKDKENLNVHRHTSCVLTDMTVSYAPQGVFTSFEEGRPVQTNITLTFKELALLTKENIKDGY